MADILKEYHRLRQAGYSPTFSFRYASGCGCDSDCSDNCSCECHDMKKESGAKCSSCGQEDCGCVGCDCKACSSHKESSYKIANEVDGEPYQEPQDNTASVQALSMGKNIINNLWHNMDALTFKDVEQARNHLYQIAQRDPGTYKLFLMDLIKLTEQAGEQCQDPREKMNFEHLNMELTNTIASMHEGESPFPGGSTEDGPDIREASVKESNWFTNAMGDVGGAIEGAGNWAGAHPLQAGLLGASLLTLPIPGLGEAAMGADAAMLGADTAAGGLDAANLMSGAAGGARAFSPIAEQAAGAGAQAAETGGNGVNVVNTLTNEGQNVLKGLPNRFIGPAPNIDNATLPFPNPSAAGNAAGQAERGANAEALGLKSVGTQPTQGAGKFWQPSPWSRMQQAAPTGVGKAMGFGKLPIQFLGLPNALGLGGAAYQGAKKSSYDSEIEKVANQIQIISHETMMIEPNPMASPFAFPEGEMGPVMPHEHAGPVEIRMEGEIPADANIEKLIKELMGGVEDILPHEKEKKKESSVNPLEQYHNLRTAGYSPEESDYIVALASNIVLASDIHAAMQKTAAPVNPTVQQLSQISPLLGWLGDPTKASVNPRTHQVTPVPTQAQQAAQQIANQNAAWGKAYQTGLHQSRPLNAQTSQTAEYLKQHDPKAYQAYLQSYQPQTITAGPMGQITTNPGATGEELWKKEHPAMSNLFSEYSYQYDPSSPGFVGRYVTPTGQNFGGQNVAPETFNQWAQQKGYNTEQKLLPQISVDNKSILTQPQIQSLLGQIAVAPPVQ